MSQEGEDLSVPKVQKTGTGLIPIVICAALAILFMNLGFTTLFYLVPLGYAVLVYSRSRAVFIAAAVINAIFCVFSKLVINNADNAFSEIIYYSVLLFGFIWIMAGNKLFNFNLRTAYRFIISSVAGSLAFLFYVTRPDSTFFIMLDDIAAMFSGTGLFEPDLLAELTKTIMLYGGSVATLLLLFYINRQIAVSVVWIVKRQRTERGLPLFFAPSNTIWVLSGSLAFILLSRKINAEILQILAWNVFVICAIIFLAQGAGIIMHFLQKKSSGFRILINVLIVVLIFSPLNFIALAAVLLLGVVECFVPMRRPKVQNDMQQ
jgi:hypothetical protein